MFRKKFPLNTLFSAMVCGFMGCASTAAVQPEPTTTLQQPRVASQTPSAACVAATDAARVAKAYLELWVFEPCIFSCLKRHGEKIERGANTCGPPLWSYKGWSACELFCTEEANKTEYGVKAAAANTAAQEACAHPRRTVIND